MIDWNNARWRKRLRRRLLAWFAVHARTLPWRDHPTPYKVWVSEIMCQQTQVATVVPYFHRFMERYPDVASLAVADDDELMRLWEGLGYYRRAASLKKAALQIVQDHGGAFPDEFDDVLALPGIGRYTAGAIQSVSRNQAAPILEGNTQRVFSRWIGLESPPSEKQSQATLWSFAESLVFQSDTADRTMGPAAINQASMELGALLCTPKNPKCDRCPVSKCCEAFRLGLQETIPGKVSKTVYESRDEYAIILRDDRARWLVRSTPTGVRFAGLWDVPRIGPPEASDLDEAIRWAQAQLGGKLSNPREIIQLKHGVTKYRITLHVIACDWKPPKSPVHNASNGWQFVALSDLARLPMHVTGRKMTQLLNLW